MSFAFAGPNPGRASMPRPAGRALPAWRNRFLQWRQRARPIAAMPAIYQIADRLHGQRTAQVTCDAIATTVSAWLAELGVDSPMAEDLAHAVRMGDWAAVYAIGEHLSVHVTRARST